MIMCICLHLDFIKAVPSVASDYVVVKLTHERQVDVFTSVQQILRSGRPEFIVSAAQYRCLHEVAANHISSGIYSADRCSLRRNIRTVSVTIDVIYVNIIKMILAS